MNKLLIVGNWKMNPDYANAIRLLDHLRNNLSKNNIPRQSKVVICPPAAYLSEFSRELAPLGEAKQGRADISLGCQDIHWEENGAWTGKLSASMLASMAVEWVILGHSELRSHFGETNADIQKKIRQAVLHNLTAIVCIGETLQQRNQQCHEEVIEKQLRDCLFSLGTAEMRHVVVAYEPVWAIGSGQSADTKDIAHMHAHIRSLLKTAFPALEEPTRLLYGGSMKAANAATLLSQPNVDGGLIGSASLQGDEFLKIIRLADEPLPCN